ncbi:hypothetical protein KM043_010392 [Ampulex compressa]|nr:hypothetical protein KM043_010392 [Ampulex compressa]
MDGTARSSGRSFPPAFSALSILANYSSREKRRASASRSLESSLVTARLCMAFEVEDEEIRILVTASTGSHELFPQGTPWTASSAYSRILEARLSR